MCLVEGCANAAVIECRVALCPKHLREVYEFAETLIARRLPTALVDAAAVTATASKDPAPVLPTRGNEPGWVYFVQFGERVKIGFSTTPYRRVADHPHDVVLGVVPGSKLSEKALHRRFVTSRVPGQREWFHATPDLLLHVRDLVAAG